MLIRSRGFTIVELLIVIVVIAILASITIVAYNGIQTRARNNDRAQEASAWKKQFELYRVDNGSLPVMPDGFYCLGRDFPVGASSAKRCRDYLFTNNSYLEDDAIILMDELDKIGKISRQNRVPVAGTVGPYVNYTSSYIQIFHVFEGSAANVCPPFMTFNWTNGSTKVLCQITLNK